jgi:hypothetical protein
VLAVLAGEVEEEFRWLFGGEERRGEVSWAVG